MSHQHVLKQLRRDCAGDQGGWAKRNGFSPTFVSLVLHGHKEPSARMAEVLGFQKVTYRCVDYVRKAG